jgi:serine protease Do
MLEIKMKKYLTDSKKYTTFLVVLSMMLLSSCATLTQSPAPATGPTAAGSTLMSPTTDVSQPIPNTGVTDLEATFEQIYTQVDPSVVNVEIEIYSSQSSALGSGFVWDTKGDIVTNNHVIDGADAITVTFSNGTMVPATVVGTDVDSDLAVIKVDLPADQLTPLQLDDSNQLKVGQIVIAIGNPFGLSGTMTSGIISALHRSIPVQTSSSSGASYSIPAVIQTDAPINPGNSGGVLLDDQGHVVGVTSALISAVDSSAGIGFAIPSAIVQKVVPGLIANGSYVHPYIGLSGATLIPEIAQAMGLDAQQHGALVVEVVPGGPADKAGLIGSSQTVTIQGQQYPIGGDIIIGVDGQVVKTFDDLISYLYLNTDVGQKIQLKVLRQGKEITVEVTLEARPSSTQTSALIGGTSGAQAASDGISAMPKAWLGILGVTVSPEIAQAMEMLADQQGLLVEEVQQGSPADLAGIQGSFQAVTINGEDLVVGGDVIIALGENPVTDAQSLFNILSQYKPDQEVFVTVLRGGEMVHVSVTLGLNPNS